MWHPIIAEYESVKNVQNAIEELEQALKQQELMVFDADQNRITKLKIAIDILKNY
jgi:predicted kinase